ncbi:hypothetical protein ACFQ0T_34675 [Kitasatospora gansuensis]
MGGGRGEVRAGSDHRFAEVSATRPGGGRLSSALRPVQGFTAAGTHRLADGTAFGPDAALPVLTGGTPADGPALFVAASRLAGPATRPFPAPRVIVDGCQVQVHWPDGTGHEALLATGAVTVRRTG